ncbi:MAG: type II secretion system protein GspF [Deltaproteobacteria bacterium RBG_13_49_15]|nr:MAG: type II secretion system protein GspF [Deltaproteobacteria bacterium RBG_13_49_15]
MPVYEYNAFDSKGKRVSGIMDAESASAARQKLRASLIYPVAVKEISAAVQKSGAGLSFRFFHRIHSAQLAVMTQELAILVGAGFPLVVALETLISQTRHPPLKKLLARVKDSVIEGNSFSEALSRFPAAFSNLYINMVHAGETSGTLEIVLERLAEMAEKQQDLNRRIRNAMTYPIFMALLGTAVLFFLMTVIVPDIAAIFQDTGRALPTPTRILISISQILKSLWWLALAILAGSVFSIVRFKNTPYGRRFFDKTILELPVVGVLVMKLSVARLARTLGSLLENGVSMISALEITKNVSGYIPISDAVEACTDEISKGTGLAEALSSRNLFPHLFIQMVRVGEQTAKLESMLEKISDMYEKDVSSQVSRATSLLEPVMILVMGLIVGFIVLSICLPIFEMNQLVF